MIKVLLLSVLLLPPQIINVFVPVSTSIEGKYFISTEKMEKTITRVCGGKGGDFLYRTKQIVYEEGEPIGIYIDVQCEGER